MPEKTSSIKTGSPIAAWSSMLAATSGRTMWRSKITDAAGRAMRWFGREKPRDIWEEAAASPSGDIEAAETIRNICRSAADSAAFVGGFAARPDHARRPVHDKHDEENARYQRAAKAAMEIAM